MSPPPAEPDDFPAMHPAEPAPRRAPAGTAPFALGLFPLQHVLFPEGELLLQVFEPRYLALVADCLRDGQPFGVVCLDPGLRDTLDATGQAPGAAGSRPPFARIGCLAHIEAWGRNARGLLQIRCRGGQRFRLLGWPPQDEDEGPDPLDQAQPPAPRADGLWQATVRGLPPDPVRGGGHGLQAVADSLRMAALSLREQGGPSLPTPPRFDDAGWVANRWAEWLPLNLADQQALMAEPDPRARLGAVSALLRAHGLPG